jgi:hypothetical protein
MQMKSALADPSPARPGICAPQESSGYPTRGMAYEGGVRKSLLVLQFTQALYPLTSSLHGTYI